MNNKRMYFIEGVIVAAILLLAILFSFTRFIQSQEIIRLRERQRYLQELADQYVLECLKPDHQLSFTTYRRFQEETTSSNSPFSVNTLQKNGSYLPNGEKSVYVYQIFIKTLENNQEKELGWVMYSLLPLQEPPITTRNRVDPNWHPPLDSESFGNKLIRN